MREFFCKVALVANLPRCREIPYGHDSPRTDTVWPRSRAKKCPLSRAGICRVERGVSLFGCLFLAAQTWETQLARGRSFGPIFQQEHDQALLHFAGLEAERTASSLVGHL